MIQSLTKNNKIDRRKSMLIQSPEIFFSADIFAILEGTCLLLKLNLSSISFQ